MSIQTSFSTRFKEKIDVAQTSPLTNKEALYLVVRYGGLSLKDVLTLSSTCRKLRAMVCNDSRLFLHTTSPQCPITVNPWAWRHMITTGKVYEAMECHFFYLYLLERIACQDQLYFAL